MTKFPSVGHRAWFALQCLPKEPNGAHPPFRRLERENGLSNNTLRPFVWDQYPRPGFEVMERIARALGTTADWLLYERGPGPTTGWLVQERPKAPPGLRKKKSSGTHKAVKNSK